MNDKPVIQKNVIPYSKGNEERKLPLKQNIFLTMGAFPINFAVAAIAQTEVQGWKFVSCVFAGTQKASGLAIAQQPVLPVYHVIICKVHEEGSEIVNPNLDFIPGN